MQTEESMHRCTEPHRSLYALRSLHVEIQIRIKLAAHKVTDCSKVPKYIKPNAPQRQNYNGSVASLFASSPPRCRGSLQHSSIICANWRPSSPLLFCTRRWRNGGRRGPRHSFSRWSWFWQNSCFVGAASGSGTDQSLRGQLLARRTGWTLSMDWPSPCWESISSDVRRSWQTLAGRGPGKLADLGAKDRTAAPSQPCWLLKQPFWQNWRQLAQLSRILLRFWEALPASMATKPQKVQGSEASRQGRSWMNNSGSSPWRWSRSSRSDWPSLAERAMFRS